MAEQKGIARMRTRDKAMEQLKRDDPDTDLTRNSLEYLIASGKLPHVSIGNKILINYDVLLEILAGGIDSAATEEPRAGIRAVKI